MYTSTTGVHYADNVYADLGQAWRFLATSKSGALSLDDYREFNGGAVVVPDNRQAFTYDALDRLTQASRSTTEGYTGTYTYDAIGNLTGKDEGGGNVAYTYTDAAHKHAVTTVGANAYTYDANGNMLTRGEWSGAWYHAWDMDNRLNLALKDNQAQYFDYDGDGKRARSVAYLNGAAALTDNFDAANAGTWTYNTYQTVPHNDGGQSVVRNVGTGVNWDANFVRNAFSLSNGESASIDFRISITNSFAHFSLETNDGGVYNRWGVVAPNGVLQVQYNVGGGFVYPKDLLPVQPDVWYRLTLRVDDADGFRVEVRERDGGTESASYQLAMPAGKNWRFHHWTYYGTVLLDNYVERSDGKTVTGYPSALYEVNATTGVATSYYFVGGKRVAVRNAAGLYFLHGDHLGSNSLRTSITGTESAR